MGTRQAVDSGWAKLKNNPLRLCSDPEFPMTLEHGYYLGKEGGKALGTNETAGVPCCKKGSLHMPECTGAGVPSNPNGGDSSRDVRDKSPLCDGSW